MLQKIPDVEDNSWLENIFHGKHSNIFPVCHK